MGSFAPPPWNSFVDGWGITHFAFYMALAFFYPQHLITIFLLGVLWELLESFFKEHPFYISKCEYKLNTDREDNGRFWYGRWQDIVMNSLGMAAGYGLTKL